MPAVLTNILKKIRSLFSGGNQLTEYSEPDLDTILERIEEREREMELSPGRRIHRFDYLHYELGIDLDITESYRVQVLEGQERIFSFSIYCKRGEYASLKSALERIIQYLEGEQNLAEMPNDEKLKGFFYGRD